MTRRVLGSLMPLLSLLLSSCVPWTVRPIGSETDKPALSPSAYVDSIFKTKLVPEVLNSAVEARVLLDALSASPAEAVSRIGRQGGFFVVKGRGVVLSVDTRSRNGLALVDIPPLDGRPDLSIQIGPVIRGTSRRDATGLVRFSDCVNQIQFADVGNELNDRVLKTVLAPLDKAGLRGRTVTFTGTLAAEQIPTDPPLRDLVPIELTVETSR